MSICSSKVVPEDTKVMKSPQGIYIIYGKMCGLDSHEALEITTPEEARALKNAVDHAYSMFFIERRLPICNTLSQIFK